MEPDNLLIVDHAELDELLEAVFVSIVKADHPHVFARLDYFWARLAMHIRAEHLHLFPALLKTALPKRADDEKEAASSPSIESLINQLRVDHNFFMSELAEAIKTMRLIRDEDDRGSLLGLAEVKQRLENVSRRLITHNETEEAQIYPLAEVVLSSNEATEIRARMKAELNNLPRRFVDDAENRNNTLPEL